jgi:hypothetical protein
VTASSGRSRRKPIHWLAGVSNPSTNRTNRFPLRKWLRLRHDRDHVGGENVVEGGVGIGQLPSVHQPQVDVRPAQQVDPLPRPLEHRLGDVDAGDVAPPGVMGQRKPRPDSDLQDALPRPHGEGGDRPPPPRAEGPVEAIVVNPRQDLVDPAHPAGIHGRALGGGTAGHSASSDARTAPGSYHSGRAGVVRNICRRGPPTSSETLDSWSQVG